MAAYIPVVLDDNRFQLEGPIQAGGKWPPTLAVKPLVEEYNGYTNTFVRLIVNTKVEGDRNEGKIEAKIPIMDWYCIAQLLQTLNEPTVRLEPIECYGRPFGKDKRPAKEDVLTHRVMIGAKDGRVYLSIIDARDDSRPKIPFYFGVPHSRWPFTSNKAAGSDLNTAKAYALGWHAAVTTQLEGMLPELHAKALSKKKDDKGRDDDDRDSSRGSSSRHDHATDVDEDLPF